MYPKPMKANRNRFVFIYLPLEKMILPEYKDLGREFEGTRR